MVLKYDDSVAFWGKKIQDSEGNILDAGRPLQPGLPYVTTS